MILKNFIVFEGIDGTGTTTQMRRLETLFHKEGNTRVFFTHEPTDGETGRFIRRVLAGAFSVHADTLAYLFAADRNEHLSGRNGIIQHINDGDAVFTDRYLFSSLVYQGESGRDDLPFILNKGFPLPERLFFFDIDPETAMDRVRSRAAAEKTVVEIFERLEFQKKIRAKYRALISEMDRAEPDMRVTTVDATLPPEKITEKIWAAVQNLPKME